MNPPEKELIAAAVSTPTIAVACPVCSAATSGPFCSNDGTMIVDSFILGDRYSVDESFGRGPTMLSFGARHLVLGRAVVLKLLRPELAAVAAQAQRFLDEARATSQIEHENIESISDLGQDASLGVTYLVTERLSGASLDRVLERPMPLDRALRVLVQIARAIGAAHAAGLAHRNLSPRNIFLLATAQREDHIKLCDFGLSLASLEGRDAREDHHVDLHAFGLIARELVPREGLPTELQDLIGRCLAVDPGDRPANAIEVEAVLTRLIDEANTLAQSTMIGKMIGTHRVVRLVGTGGIGTVYQAEHPLIGNFVAIKVLRPEVAVDPSIVERFVLEARASNLINSPHIPRYIDFGHLPNGQPFAVMEFLVGETLRARLSRDERLPLDQVVVITTQVASAMTLAHAQGIVHRDLKPDNVFLEGADRSELLVKVLDFGAAKLLTEDVITRTQVGLEFGTLCYCAPEQALGGSVGPAADVYALGATMFEMLTGEPPFKAALLCVAEKTTKAAPSVHKLRPDLPAAVERDLAAMLARNPAARPSMAQLLTLLEGWTPEPKLPAPTVDAPDHHLDGHPDESSDKHGALAADDFDESIAAPSPRRWAWFAAGAALIVVVIVAIAVGNGSSASDRNAGTDTRRTMPRVPSAAPADRAGAVNPAAKPPSVGDTSAAVTNKSAADAATASGNSGVGTAAIGVPAPDNPPAASDTSGSSSGSDRSAVKTSAKPITDKSRSDTAGSPDTRRPSSASNKRSTKSTAKPDDGVIVDPFKD